MKRTIQKTVCFSAVLAYMLSACSASNNNNHERTDPMPVLSDDYQLPENMEDGSILHAWAWSFNTIKENLPEIAKAGFKSVQTSPINEIVIGENGGMNLQDTEDSAGQGKWYYMYQPASYQIGNYMLGSEEELKALCEEADKYGIKIIADAVVNHMTSDESAIKEEIYQVTHEPFHNKGELTNYNDREDLTQKDLLGLKDLNTQNEEIQQRILSYLKQAVEDGVDGFRYDAAKHIELPNDNEAYASDFWNVILDNGSEFQYGEILQGATAKQDEYAKLMKVTASDYGQSVRNALAQKNLLLKKLQNYQSYGVDDDQLVLWVESHDNYCNDGSWQILDEDQIAQGWALIASRASGTPLFFSRPNNSTTEDQWGDNTIGKRGSDAFMSETVTEINKFRNQMTGLDETLSNPMDNSSLLMIERGTSGAVIVSVSDEEIQLDASSVLNDGTYEDKLTKSVFTVKDGKITGTIAPNSVTILY